MIVQVMLMLLIVIVNNIIATARKAAQPKELHKLYSSRCLRTSRRWNFLTLQMKKMKMIVQIVHMIMKVMMNRSKQCCYSMRKSIYIGKRRKKGSDLVVRTIIKPKNPTLVLDRATTKPNLLNLKHTIFGPL